ncbi:MAG: beta,4-mannosyltransferase, partial [Microbacteriaceae bacterium]|nr:beta,4-mannosyltransferase [Microbacteriaceae bacterium]
MRATIVPAERGAHPRPLRVLTSLPGRGRNTNPYLLQLIDGLAARPDVDVRYFSWRRALTGGYDVLHVHWPERLLRGSTPARALARRALVLLLLVRLRLTRIALVRTMHNLRSHEAGGPAERALLAAFDRATDLWIRLNPFTPLPPGAPARTIVHGHYRNWFERSAPEPAVPGRLLFFGLLRPYKGVEELLDAFTAAPADASLRLVGSAQDPTLKAAVEQAQQRDPRISSRIEYVPDAELAGEIEAAQVVVLPYRAVHNSGAALLALSLGRPVLMPRTDTTSWLQQEVGEDWLLTYEPPLTA